MGRSARWLCLLAVVRALSPGVAIGEWVTKRHKGMPWDTTSDPADMRAEVKAGATILKYTDGSYVHAIHRQYPQACGPASLAIVLKHMRIAQRRRRQTLPRNVDCTGNGRVNVGYVGSMEHIMWLGYHRVRLAKEREHWNANDLRFMSLGGDLNIEASGSTTSVHGPSGRMGYLRSDAIPGWLWHGPAVGTGHDRDAHTGLTGIMNYIIAGSNRRARHDAMPLTTFGRNEGEAMAVRRIFKGYVDHNIAVVLCIESGGHFNVVIGYRGKAGSPDEPFYIYTADPLDGWGRPKESCPGRWRRMAVIKGHLFGGGDAEGQLIYQMICWNQHLRGGCAPNGWAQKIDRANGNDWLCGRLPPRVDPLHDPLSGKFGRYVKSRRR